MEEDLYRQERARDIHLNPLRAGLVRDLTALARDRWAGHTVVVVVGVVAKKLKKRLAVGRLAGGGAGAIVTGAHTTKVSSSPGLPPAHFVGYLREVVPPGGLSQTGDARAGPLSAIGASGIVRFQWKDDAHGNRLKTMALPAAEFLARFLLPVLPDGFVRIRHFGLLANRGRAAKLARGRALLGVPPPVVPTTPESAVALLLRVTGVDVTRCPVCRVGRLHVIGRLRPGALPVAVVDTS